MPPCLEHAGAAPPDGAEHLPPADRLAVDRRTADALVPGEQVLVGADPADWFIPAEAPSAHAQVAEVLHRVAAMDELPVEHGPDPVLADDQVAVAEVAVEHHLGARSG